MVRTHPVRYVVYDRSHWDLLKSLRSKAMGIMDALERRGIYSIVYGSIARGDVKQTSDIDVFIPYVIPSHEVEIALESAKYEVLFREIVQATPSHVVKGYIYIDDLTTVSFPLIPMNVEEESLYSLAGKLSIEDLKNDRRVPGITKDLLVIVPTNDGHYEFSLKENFDEAAKILSVNPEMLRRRFAILKRRKECGKTGVFFSKKLDPDQSFEEILRDLINRSPMLRKRLREIY